MIAFHVAEHRLEDAEVLRSTWYVSAWTNALRFCTASGASSRALAAAARAGESTSLR
jgi:hypothetical protein